MMQKEKVNVYSYDLKVQVVKEFYQGHAVPDLVQRHELNNRRLVYKWTSKVRQGGFDALKDERGGAKSRKVKRSTLEEELEVIRLENLYLKKLLDLKRG